MIIRKKHLPLSIPADATADLGDVRGDKDLLALSDHIKHVLSRIGLKKVIRAIGHALKEYRLAQFVTAFNLKLKSCWYDRNDDNVDALLDIRALRLDHPRSWFQDGKSHYLTSEPYYATKDELRRLIQVCDKKGIDFQIDAESMYFPGHTIRILFKKGEMYMADVLNHQCFEFSHGEFAEEEEE